MASAAHGSTDAIVDAVTGLLHEPGDHAALVAHVLALANDAGLRSRLGNAARARVVAMYSEAAVTQELGELYEALIG